ncbi:MAG: hypothetical protein EA427_17395 [Spirochaetaceae bacterium]|nr:MAG: hypothetical protein EA427_17395 [Spirochaetaceae bacterium]
MLIELYDQREQAVRDAVMEELHRIESSQLRTCRHMEENLQQLSEVFSGYPSILDQRSLGNEIHSLETLIEVLYRDGCDHTILLPTKVIVGRSFIVAKFNFFGLLLYLCDRYESLAVHRKELQRIWEYAVFALLVEDVYQVIIERQGSYDPRIRRHAAVDLIHMWEYRFDQHVNEYAATIVELWRARKRIAPVFGTMLGTMELVGLSSLLPQGWYQFVADHGQDEEVMQALEEFIFGLVYEDIQHVRREMRDRNIPSLGREGLETMLRAESNPREINSTDPREMYRFFQRRSRRLVHRRIAGGPGPRRTLEEVFLAYLIEGSLEDPGSLTIPGADPGAGR